jgi:hypothetical protein
MGQLNVCAQVCWSFSKAQQAPKAKLATHLTFLSMSTTTLPTTQPVLYFLTHEHQRRSDEWDFEQLKHLFAEAVASCGEVSNSPGLQWTVV